MVYSPANGGVKETTYSPLFLSLIEDLTEVEASPISKLVTTTNSSPPTLISLLYSS